MTKEIASQITWQKILFLMVLAVLVGISAFKLSSDSDLADVSQEKTKMEELGQDAGN